ncbi:hypothetical protein NXX39_25500 [Bacteroides ovatus]|uniref:hypothetical protein n=1 Tax=Bacteroides ovatus TaxID=28116 RepID=UPI0021658514|nr:hypothetical protein [Bacteroides ovatus]MCS2476390.1 hypothetical protein [Bacteroides ovatus]
MSNLSESPYHRDYELAHGYLWAPFQKASSQDSTLLHRATRMSHCWWIGGV